MAQPSDDTMRIPVSKFLPVPILLLLVTGAGLPQSDRSE